MTVWLLCFLQIIAYTVGVMVACGLAMELCYRLFFFLLGRRVGRAFWYVTMPLGAPVHELGHAITCLLFGHKIERIRLFPTRAGGACVVHTYDKKNPYAAFGNLCISLGPLITGFSVILLVLWLIFPLALSAYLDSLELLLSEGSSVHLFDRIFTFVCAFLFDVSHPLWLRCIGFYLLLSMTLHVRLSTADLYEMRFGIPGVLVLAALGATVAVAWGAEVRFAMIDALRRFALIVAALFAVMLLIAAVLIALAAVIRMVCGIFGIKLKS